MPGYFAAQGPASSDPGRLEDYEASWRSYVGHSFGGIVDDATVLKGLILPARYAYEDAFGERVDAKTARDEIAKRGLPLDVPDDGISRYKLDALMYLKQREITRSQVFASRSGPITTVSGLAAALAGGLTDPVNLASSFIPVVNAAKYAAAAKAATSTLGRAAVGARVGALEGLVGAAVTEPLNFFGAEISQSEYTLLDSFANVTLGTIIGSGLHAAAGAAFGPRTVLEALERTLPESKIAEVNRATVADVEIGIKPRPDAQLREAVQEAAGVRVPRDVLDAAPQTTRAAARDITNTIRVARSAPEDLVAGERGERGVDFMRIVKRLGGFKTRDAEGNLVPFGGEVEQLLGGKSSKTGKTPDELVEHFMEAKWIGKEGRDDAMTAMDEFLEIVDEAARGRRPQPPGEADGISRYARAEALKAAEYDVFNARAELEQAGVLDTDTARQAYKKLKDYRVKRDLEMVDPREILRRESDGAPYNEADAPIEAPPRDPVMEQGEVISADVSTRLKSLREDADWVAQTQGEIPDFTARIEIMRKEGRLTADDEAELKAGLANADAFKRWGEVYEAAAMCTHEAAE